MSRRDRLGASDAERPARAGLRLLAALMGALLVWAATDSVYVLPTGQEALVVRLGRPLQPVDTPAHPHAGLHLKLPLIDRVVRFDARTQYLEAAPLDAVTADGRAVLVDAFLHYRIRQPVELLQAAGDVRTASDSLGQMLNATVRGTVERLTYAQLSTGAGETLLAADRAALSAQSRAQGLGLEIVDIGLSRFDPTPSEVQAALHRMQAAQTARAEAIRAAAEQQKQTLVAQADKDAKVIRATAIGQGEAIWGEGDAGRAAIFAKAYGEDPSFAHFYQAMRAYEAALGDKQTTLILSPSSAFFQAFQKGPGAR